MTKFIEIITTTDSLEESQKLANEILRLKLAACCSIMPIESFFWWKNKIENAPEFQLVIKTIESNYLEIETYILHNHSYDTPQIISIPILGGSRDYIDWLQKEVKQKD